MSYELTKQVWQLDPSPTQQHVLMALADYANDEGGSCYPSQPRLAWKTGYTERTIARTINGFIETGIVKVLRLGTNKKPPHYQICLDAAKEKAPYSSDNGDSRDDTRSPQDEIRDDLRSPQDEVRGDHRSPQESLGRQAITPGGDLRSGWGDLRSPDPIINQSINRPDNGSVPLPEKATEKTKARIPEADLAGMWLAYLQEQRKEHKTMTDWLQGSELIATGEQRNGRALYRIWVADASHLDWLRRQAGGLISRDLRGILGKRVALDIVAELAGVAA